MLQWDVFEQNDKMLDKYCVDSWSCADVPKCVQRKYIMPTDQGGMSHETVVSKWLDSAYTLRFWLGGVLQYWQYELRNATSTMREVQGWRKGNDNGMKLPGSSTSSQAMDNYFCADDGQVAILWIRSSLICPLLRRGYVRQCLNRASRTEHTEASIVPAGELSTLKRIRFLP